MSHDLKLIDGEGWILTMRNIPKNCEWCKEELKTPFYFCKDLEKGYCKNCEKTKICKFQTFHGLERHEHFNIIQVDHIGDK